MAWPAVIYGGDRKFVELCGANFRQEGAKPPMKKVADLSSATFGTFGVKSTYTDKHRLPYSS